MVMRLQIIKQWIYFALGCMIVLLLQSAVHGQVSYMSVPDRFQVSVKTSFLDSIHSDKVQIESLSRSLKRESKWLVYSDRAKNTLNHRPGGPANGDFLDYMEQVAVEKVEGNWLYVRSLVYDKERPIVHDKVRGWIKAENLVLSRNSLLNTKGTPRKAMILVSLENLDPGKVNLLSTTNYFYNQPLADYANKNGKNATKFDIYFVLKETKGSLLLSKTDHLNETESLLAVAVPGWMPKSNVTFWDHRVCLEPSATRQANIDYSGKTLPIFDSREQLKRCLVEQEYESNKKNVIKTCKVGPTRPRAEIMRMPILQNHDAETKEVASIASLEKSEEATATIQAKLQTVKAKLANVNVLFVVDATQSMKNYFLPIAKSIGEIIRNNQDKGSTTNLRFGLAIYRDYADGEDAYRIIPLTSNHQSIANAVLAIKPFSNDTDLPEAQYNGLVRGIKEAGFDATHSNIVVLVGDAGNHQPDPKGRTVGEVVDLMFKYQISMVTFQVISGRDPSYLDFNRDARTFLRKSAEKYVIDPKTVKLSPVNIQNTYKLGFLGTGNGEHSLFMFGRFTYASETQSMDSKVLETNVTEALNDYLGLVDDVRAKIESAGDGKGSGEAFTPEFESLLKQKGFTESDIEILKTAGEFTAKGHTSMKFYEKTEPCFVPVVFMSANEKSNMVEIFNKLVKDNQSTITEKKESFKNALVAQCQGMLGVLSTQNILDKTLNEIWDIILGIPFEGYGNLGNTKLIDLNKISDENFDKFFKSFSLKFEKFKKENRDERFTLAGQNFFWVPLKDMPGNE